MSEPQRILGYGDGRYVENPRAFGFEWPQIQEALDLGRKLYEHTVKLYRERQELEAEKESLEQDLIQAQAGAYLARSGLADEEIGAAVTRIDVPKSQKRLDRIQKRLEELQAELAAIQGAVGRHKGVVENAFAAARQDGKAAQEVQEANVSDAAELQELEEKIAAIRHRIVSREQLGQMVGLIGLGVL